MASVSGTRGFNSMRLSVLGSYKRQLAQGAAIIILGGLASGCSSDAMRFTYGSDGMFTGATSNQRQIIAPNQAYPGDSVPPAAVDGSHTGSIAREAVKPVDLSPPAVSHATLAPVAGTKLAAADSKPLIKVKNPDLAPAASGGLDKTTTGTVKSDIATEADPAGWSRAGGTQVTAKEGETIYNLSKRFGVPADVLMKTNGIAEGTGLRAGQKIVIPTYVYNSKAPVSAPDHNPKVADAKSSHGNKSDTPAKLPAPADAPSDKVAVLPKSPKLKEGETQPPAEATSAKGDRVASSKSGSYTVASGDTLSKIAKKNGVSVVALKKANGLNDGLLKVGQALKIPAGGGEQVASAAKPGVDPIVTGAAGPTKKAAAEQVAGYTPPKKADKVIADAEDEDASAAPGGTGIGKMRWPVRGRVISNYGSGSGKSNDGIDISVPEGTPVKAAENGVVIYAGDGLKDFGNTVLVRHENGLVTVYGHASSLEVKRGEKVKRGQEIARSGMSGTTDAPKLHFEVRKDSSPVDPSTFLE